MSADNTVPEGVKEVATEEVKPVNSTKKHRNKKQVAVEPPSNVTSEPVTEHSKDQKEIKAPKAPKAPKPKEPRNPHLVRAGFGAGERLKEEAEYCLFVGRNAGKQVTTGKRVVVIGDDLPAKDADDQFIIGQEIPHIHDIHMVRFLQVYPNIIDDVKKNFSTKFTSWQISAILKRLEDIYDDITARIRVIELTENLAAEQSYAKFRSNKKSASHVDPVAKTIAETLKSKEVADLKPPEAPEPQEQPENEDSEGDDSEASASSAEEENSPTPAPVPSAKSRQQKK